MIDEHETIEPGTPEHQAYLAAFPVHATAHIDPETLAKNFEKEEAGAKVAAREERFKCQIAFDYVASGRIKIG